MVTLLLIVSAFLAGILNAVAGGGSFLTFPALVMAGVPPVEANATSTVAVFPGALASFVGYRSQIRDVGELSVKLVVVVSLIGGAAGAVLLLKTPENVFEAIAPWLLLAATLLFAFGRQASAWLRARVRIGPVTVLLSQFAIAVYGGYFGGGMGIMMLAVYSLYGLTNLHAMNGMKALSAGLLNAVAVVAFVAAHAVHWHEALIMAASALAGGYTGAHVAQRIDQRILRAVVIATGVAMTIWFFTK